MPERPTRVDILFGLAYPDSRVRRAATALAAAGYAVRVLAWDRSGHRPARGRDGDVRVEHARVASRSGRGALQLPFLTRAVWRHLPSMRRDPPDVLHAVDLPMLAAGLGLQRLLGNPRIVYDAFELYALMESHKYPGWLLRGVEAAERRLPRRADLVIVPGEARRAFLAARGVESVVVGNWIDPPPVAADPAAARRALGVRPDRFCVAYAGGLEASRDLEPLLGHARRHAGDEVLIAGRGEQAPRIAAVASALPNVHYAGWLDDPSDVYSAADALYYALDPRHPYADHPAPNNLYAAIAHAVPLIHRRQGEIGEVARRAEIGAAFDDDASLDAAIDDLRAPERRARIRAELRALQSSHTARRAAEALLAAYPLPPSLDA